MDEYIRLARSDWDIAAPYAVALCVAQLLDTALGMIIAFRNKELSSSASWKGVTKKVAVLIVLAFAGVVFAFCIAGIALLTSLLPIGFLADVGSMAGRGLAGFGLLAGGIGGGALFLLLVEVLARLLVKYARLHYRLLTSATQAV